MPKPLKLSLKADGPEKAGELTIVEGPYGYDIYLAPFENPILHIDLYGPSEANKVEREVPNPSPLSNLPFISILGLDEMDPAFTVFLDQELGPILTMDQDTLSTKDDVHGRRWVVRRK